ncbi:MAG TPA: heme peroxidase family protein [Thermoleophilaceae bacterium]|nr:heme peroxidase family protein [Thermoleophilaceae bacterium]
MPTGQGVARHGTVVPPGQDVDASREAPTGRFGQLFPGLLPCELSDGAIDEIVAWMGDKTRSRAANPRIPAGFTYLGQFIDHDITFDPTTTLNANVDAEFLINFRTPRFDLDSVYGAGRVVQPFLYDWKSEPEGVSLLTGRSGDDQVEDLPRNSQGRALIGDPRNDETAIIAQLHLLFIRFHNAVVERLVDAGRRRKANDLFEAAQKLVRWHYQWIVVHEFLPAVVGEAIADDVISSPADGSAPEVALKFFDWRRHPFIPVEFSGAAYRFGHSMVRRAYGVKRPAPGAGVTAAIEQSLPIFPDLAGFRPLSDGVIVEWERLFAVDGAPLSPQVSLMVDTSIASPLFELPDEARDQASLPRRNLERGRRLGLPSGQDIAAVMHEPPLTEDELELAKLPKSRDELKAAAPLWYYLLCETARAVDPQDRPRPGTHLGPVGGRIVAEVLVGLLAGDRNSYLHSDPPWQPRELGTDGSFTMADFIKIAQSWRAPEPG